MAVVGIVLPGTRITPIVEKVLSSPENRQTLGKESGLPVIKVGSGLIQVGEDVMAVKAGCLYYGKPNRFWIEHRQKRYVPSPNDLVVGIITARLADAYKVDLGSNCAATLNFSGFEGTTKKNRPNLIIGDVVYARVSIANKDLEPELVCLDADNKPEGFGEVKEGMLFKCSCNFAQSLQKLDNPVLELLGPHFAFEIIVGVNGRFILNAAKPSDVIKLGNIILQSAQQDLNWINERIKGFARAE